MSDSDKKELGRRGFLAGGMAASVLSLTAAASVCLCCLGGCKKNKADTPVISTQHVQLLNGRISVDISEIKPLGSVGGAAKVVHPKLDGEILVIRAAERRYVALSNRCTHRGGEVSYDKKRERLVCGNYGHSVFRISGEVVNGPANRSLKAYRTLIYRGKLEIFT